jgi:hypothetical protein
MVIEHPMKRRRAHDSVEHTFKRQMQQIARDQANALTKSRQMPTRGTQHVLGEIHPNDPAARQGFEKLHGQTASPASAIEHHFIAAQSQARQNFLPPADLRF